ncbi:MAG: sulfocyanin-like copper-binding protein [Actinomycetota bacterium]
MKRSFRSWEEAGMQDRIRRYAVMGAAAALFVAAGCSSDSGGVGVTEADFSITLDESTAPAGEVTFDIQNDAEQTHEFVVFKTDLAPDALPTNEDGDVDEEGEGVEHIDEVEDIAGGSSAELTANLDAGAYVLICNLPGHYAQGMHTEFTVE